MTNSNGDSASTSSGDVAPTMVPITREFLRQLYAGYPDPELSPEFDKARERVRSVTKLPPIEEAPHRIDECMFAARCACEEAGLVQIAQTLELFQETQRAHVSKMIARFLPDDFRGWIFQSARTQSEARNKAAVEELVRNGGSVREKYALLWEQQWGRRETLSMVGNAKGVWKLAVRYIAGVPQPLIDFAKQINTRDGPTEELRLKFAPVLHRIVELARELAALKSVIGDGETVSDLELCNEVFENAASVLKNDTERFCKLLTKVVSESPFFVTSEQIDVLKKEDVAKK